jgi:hypothetical protein
MSTHELYHNHGAKPLSFKALDITEGDSIYRADVRPEHVVLAQVLNVVN